MHLAGKTKRRLVDEINITPLTDVFLVLLIIMMVMAPMMKMTRMDIRMPEVAQGGPLDPKKLVIEVTREGGYYIDGTETPVAELANVLRSKAIDPPEQRGLIVQGDREALSKYVVSIFAAAKEAEYRAVTLAVATTPVRANAAPVPPETPATPGETATPAETTAPAEPAKP